MTYKEQKNKSVLIISGGSIDREWFAKWYAQQEIIYCIAADKGLETAHALGIHVDYILGDYDSVDSDILDTYRHSTELITYPSEKDYTDTHLAVKKGIEVIDEFLHNREENTHRLSSEILKDSVSEKLARIPEEDTTVNSYIKHIDDICLYIVGATGTRLDHVLTNISILKEPLSAGIDAYIIDAHNKLYLKNTDFTISKLAQYGNYVSFIPLTESARVSIKGMKYELTDQILYQGTSLTQSNEVAASAADIVIKAGTLIVVEARD